MIFIFLKCFIPASVSSPIVAGGLRNIHDNKVAGPLPGNSANHHADNPRHGSSDDYLHMVHRLSSDVCNVLVINVVTADNCLVAQHFYSTGEGYLVCLENYARF